MELKMIRYSIGKQGSPSFPIFTVWADPEDENGFLIEYESVQIGSFNTFQQAQEFANSQQQEK